MALETRDNSVSIGNAKDHETNLFEKFLSLITPLFFRRLLVTVIGYFFLAFGVVLIVKSDLGIAPVNAISFVMSIIFTADLGLMTAIIYTIYILLQLAILRKDFRFTSFLQLPMNFIFSFFLSLCMRIFTFQAPQMYVLRLLCHLSAVVIVSFGICIYLRARLPPLPPEGFILAVKQKSRMKLQNIKVTFDFTIMIIALIFSLVAAGRIIGMREGTFISMLAIGKTLGFFSKYLGPKIDTIFKLQAGE